MLNGKILNKKKEDFARNLPFIFKKPFDFNLKSINDQPLPIL